MRRRRILVVHDSSMIRKVVRRYLLSELDDVEPIEVESTENGLDEICRREYDLVISGNEMTQLGGVEVFQKMQTESANRATPFLLITSNGKEEHLCMLSDKGIENVLVIPFSPRKLAEEVNRLCNPRGLRRHERVSFLDMRVSLHLDHDDLEAEVVNFSTGGFLCDLSCTAHLRDLVTIPQATLHILADCGGGDIKAEVQFMRLSVLGWKSPKKPERIRVAWKILSLWGDGEARLKHAVESAKAEFESAMAQ